MNTPQISIITPVWNGLPYIRECVESVLAQDFQDWEMLISDNASTDNTFAYLQTLSDPRIRIFRQEENLGIFKNLNFLLSAAQSEICQMLCADDYFIDKGSLTTIINFWKNAAEEVGYARFNHNDVVQCHLTAFQKKVIPEIIRPDEADLMFYIFGGSLSGNLSNLSMRLNLLRKFGFFREDLPFAGDFEFWSRIARNVPSAIVNDTVIFVREHPRSASFYQNRNGELVRQNAEIVQELYDHLESQNNGLNFALQLHGTLNYDSLQRDVAIRAWLHGNRGYMNELERVSSNSVFLLPGAWKWVLFILSLGGRIGRVSSAKYLMRVYMHEKAEMKKGKLHVEVKAPG